jgi:hypothetical protein
VQQMRGSAPPGHHQSCAALCAKGDHPFSVGVRRELRRARCRTQGGGCSKCRWSRGFGIELSEALSRYVLRGIMWRNDAGRAMSLTGRPPTGGAVDQALSIALTHFSSGYLGIKRRPPKRGMG